MKLTAKEKERLAKEKRDRKKLKEAVRANGLEWGQ